MAGACEACGAAVPWGTPRCLQCGAGTVWWRALSGFGILVGAGTALVVTAVIARVWLMPPPPEVKWRQQIADFVARAAGDPVLRGRIAGAGRCRRPAGALCVQMTPEFTALPLSERQHVIQTVHSLHSVHPVRESPLQLVAPDGSVIEERKATP